MKKTFLIILIALSFIPSISKAEDKYTLLEPLPCISGVGDCAAGTIQPDISINNYILYVYKFSIALAIFLAIVMIIWGGFLYITSEVPFIKSDGKSKIQNAVTGLIMVLVSYLILQTIDPRLVNIDANIPQIGGSGNSKALDDFQSQLATDLNNISSENQIKYYENSAKIKDLEKDKISIDGRQANGEITKEEAKIQKDLKDAEIKALNSDTSVALAEAKGIKVYAGLFDQITNSDGQTIDMSSYSNIVPGTPENMYPENTPNTLQNQYDIEINKLLKINAYEHANKLIKQRDYLVGEVKEEYEFRQLVNFYSNGSYMARNQYQAELEGKISQYDKDLKDTNKQISSGLKQDQYNKIIQTRIDTINQTLTTGKSKP